MKKYLPLLAFLAYTILLFRPLFVEGKLPIPASALVSGYFPWNAGGWEGAPNTLPRAEIIATDVFRQQLPWINLSVLEIRQGKLPLWNPYNFSGMPLMANLQSHVWFPWTLVFLALPLLSAWTLFIVSVPLSGMIGMYLFLRMRGLSLIASLFGGIGFSSMGFMVLWLPWGFIPYGAVLLPWILWAIERLFRGTSFSTPLLALFLAFELVSGYAQVVMYALLFASTYFVWRLSSIHKKSTVLKKAVLALATGLLLSSVQLIPSFEAYVLSGREIAASTKLFYDYLLPPGHLITALAPNFFGNPMTFNFWGSQHHEYMSYFGIVALILATYRLVSTSSESSVRFFGLVGFISLLFAFVKPIASTLVFLNVPILNSGIPSRTLFLVQTSLVILAAEGFHSLKSIRTKPLYACITLLGVALVMVAAGSYYMQSSERAFAAHMALALRSLRLPILLFGAGSILLIFLLKRPRFRKAVSVALIVLAIFEYTRFFGQNVAFSPKEYVYPKHPLIEWLQERPEYYRHWGYDEARFDHNFATYYRLFSAEGFDSLYPRSYGEFLSSAKDGTSGNAILRSDAIIPKEETKGRQRLLDLLSIRFLLARTDRGDTSLISQYKKEVREPIASFGDALVYENETALPRAYMVNDFLVIPNREGRIRAIFGSEFDPKKQVILTENPHALVSQTQSSGSARIVRYESDRVEIYTFAQNPSLLVLTDQYYPGWKGEVDGAKQKILQANEAFRAVVVPQGEHTVVFKYDPKSVRAGLLMSVLGVCAVFGLTVIDRKYV